MAQSENLSNSIEWSPTNVNVTGSAIASPDGLASGTLLIATSGNVQHNINRNATTSITSGTTITASCFFKAHGTNTFIQIAVGGFTFSPASPFANFNLSGNGAITTGTYSSAFIQNYGNGWYRCGLTATAAANGTNNLAIVPIIASGTARNPVFQGDGVNGVYAWGAQVETGSIATSYIPTTTAAVTRNADVINLSGAVSGCIGQTEGTLYWEGNALSNNTNTQDIIFINRNVTNSVVFLKTSTTNWVARIYAGGSAALSIIDTTVRTGFLKVAIAYKSGNTTFYINGTKIGSTSTTAFTFTAALDSVVFGHAALLFGTGNQQCRAVALYTTRLSDTELAALTTL
jgi:hypothetical protein